MAMKSTYLIHPEQIVTNKRTIQTALWDISSEVPGGLIVLLYRGLKEQEDYLRLFSICSRLENLSKMVYKGRDGVKKPSYDLYDHWLFEIRYETKGDIRYILKNYGDKVEIDESETEKIFKMYQTIKMLWLRMVSNVGEIAFLSEYAYAFEYVRSKGADIPLPEYENEDIFPCNYDGYDYDRGIAEYFDSIIFL